MAIAPSRCPRCGEKEKWILVDRSRSGFSIAKAAVGAAFFGKAGLLAGILGKKRCCYYCKRCGLIRKY